MSTSIDKLKLAKLAAAATEINNMLDWLEVANIPPANKLEFIRGSYQVFKNLLQCIGSIGSKIDLEALQDEERAKFVYSVSWVLCAVERYERVLDDTTTFLKLSGYDVPPITNLCEPKPIGKAGRPKADKSKHISDFLINCDVKKVSEAIRNDPKRGTAPKYYYCLVAALYELGYITHEPGTKELYHALKNTFGEIGSYDSFQDGYKDLEDTASSHRITVDKIKEIF